MVLLYKTIKVVSHFAVCVNPPLTASPSPPSDLESRWPGGQNVILYRKVRLEEFAPYIRPDGLVKRLSTYQDEECERQKTGSNAAVRCCQPLMSDSVCVLKCVRSTR